MNALLKALSTVLLVLYYWIESVVLAFVPKRLRYKDVSRETVLVTGGGSGIGRLLAARFAGLGARVVLWDVNSAGNAETAELVRHRGGEAFTYELDISDRQAVYETAARVKDEVGIVTVLVNNAGIITGSRLLDTPDDKIVKTIAVNAVAHFWTVKAFLPDMIAANHGHIVCISSLAGLGGSVRLTDYCASKFAAIGFQESLAMELHSEGHVGIHSTIVCPFFINTGMFAGVRTKILKMLEPDFVADEIMGAILTNQKVILIPKIFYVLYVLKSLLPVRAAEVASDSFGFNSAMVTFTGRSPSEGAGQF